MRPLLFLLYFNDVSSSSEVFNFMNFADDNTVSFSHPSYDALYASFNEALFKASEWLRVNRLSLNVAKTCYFIICSKKVEERRIEIAGIIIKRTDKVRFLVILIDDSLFINDHVRGLQKPVSLALGMLNKVSKSIPAEVKLKA